MEPTLRPLAVVTGASSGIGYELAKCCALKGYDLIIAADEELIFSAQEQFIALGSQCSAFKIDLSTPEGVEELYEATAQRPVDCLLANAGHGLGHGFFDQEYDDIQNVVDTNISGTIYLVHLVGKAMRQRGCGRILLTGSVAGFMPGSFQAVYNATKAFIDSFSYAIRNELKDSGVTVTCLMPGATETRFFQRAGMEDTAIAQGSKDEPSHVAHLGIEAMLKGEAGVVAGLNNKIEVLASRVIPDETLAEMHRRKAEPGSANKPELKPAAPF